MEETDIFKIAGGVFRDERESYNIQQADLAKMLNVSQSYISKVETGRKKMDMEELMVYCKALRMTITEYAAKVEYRYYYTMPKDWVLKKYGGNVFQRILAIFHSFSLTQGCTKPNNKTL